MLVADVDRRRRRLGAGEQPPLRLVVVLHRPVQVEVVLGEIREDQRLETDAVEPPKVEPCEEASSATLRSPASSISRKSRWRSIASGVVCGAGRVTPPTTHSIVPTSPAWRPAASSTDRRRNAVVDFPFVPVTPDHLERLRRLAEKRIRSDGHRGAGVVDQHWGTVELERPLDHEGGGTGRDRLAREVVPVGPRTGHAEERGPGAPGRRRTRGR